MDDLKKFSSLEVKGKRWFQSSFGNTYHSVSIIVDDVEVSYIPFAYGYDDSYMNNTAMAWLKENNYISNSYNGSMWRYFEGTGISFNHGVTDVKRKKDL